MLVDKDREKFIAENKTFVQNTANNICKKRLCWENDDELSIALIAFNIACENYKNNKGNFFSYAKVVIRNALIDFFRKGKNNDYLVFENDDDNEQDYIDNKLSLNEYEKEMENKLREEEIKMLSDELLDYQLSFSDLVESSPSHRDTRDEILNIVFKCIKDNSIVEHIKNKKRLPVKQIIILTGKNRKYIEKWRRYILVLIIILSNKNYNYIRSYLNIKLKNEVIDNDN
jgi:RNA polymerase sigma factor